MLNLVLTLCGVVVPQATQEAYQKISEYLKAHPLTRAGNTHSVILPDGQQISLASAILALTGLEPQHMTRHGKIGNRYHSLQAASVLRQAGFKVKLGMSDSPAVNMLRVSWEAEDKAKAEAEAKAKAEAELEAKAKAKAKAKAHKAKTTKAKTTKAKAK